MQLVVVMAVRKAVSAATVTFATISTILFFIVPADTIHYSLFTLHSRSVSPYRGLRRHRHLHR